MIDLLQNYVSRLIYTGHIQTTKHTFFYFGVFIITRNTFIQLQLQALKRLQKFIFQFLNLNILMAGSYVRMHQT